MKSLNEMELEDWELLPDDGYLEINEDGGKRIYSPRKTTSPTVFQMNYFICPPKSVEITNNQQLSPVTIHPQPQDQIKSFSAVDPDPVSQVFFKKMKEAEFVDMKLDSPKTPGSASRGFMPHLGFQLDENREEEGNNNNNDDDDLEMKSEKIMELDGEDEGGLNIWKWSLTGIGAICSFGVVAATFCIICFSTHNKNAQHHNRKLQFQIYTNEKRMKQVVHHASKLNEAISRAHVTFGGYYDASV